MSASGSHPQKRYYEEIPIARRSTTDVGAIEIGSPRHVALKSSGSATLEQLTDGSFIVLNGRVNQLSSASS